MAKLKVAILLLVIYTVSYSFNLNDALMQINKTSSVNNIYKSEKTMRTNEMAALLDTYNSLGLTFGYNLSSEVGNSSKFMHGINFNLSYGDFGYNLNYDLTNKKMINKFSFNRNINSIFADNYGLLKLRNKVSKYSSNNNINSYKLNIANIYLNILYNQKELEILEKTANLSQRIAKLNDIKYKKGAISLVDKEKSEITYKTDLLNIEKLKLDIQSKKLSLQNEGIDFDLNEKFEDVVINETKLDDSLSKERTLISLKKDLAKKEFQNYLVTRLIPNFNIFADYTLETKTYAVGLNFSYNINIFDSSRDVIIDNYKNSEENYKKSMKELEIKDSIDKLSVSQEITYKNINKQQLELAEKEFSLLEKQYEYGIISLLDLERAKLRYQSTLNSNLSIEKAEIIRKLQIIFDGE